MAKATLPTDFQNDVLNSSMGGLRRYILTEQSDGTYTIEDASTYDTIGSSFGADQLNATNEAVNESADANKIIDDADTLLATTEDGYIAGAAGVAELINDVNDDIVSDLNAHIVMTSHSVSLSGTLSAYNITGEKTVTLTKSGYYPIGIVGHYIEGSCYLNVCNIRSASSGSATIVYQVCNAYDSSQTYKISNIGMLWRKIMS